jgi:hypothetical protein
MRVVALDNSAQQWARTLERRERLRTGANAVDARKAVARRTGILPGTIENIVRGRTKGVRGWIIETLRSALIKEFENEIARLSHERDLVLAMGLRADAHQAEEMAVCLETAKELLKEIGR